MNKKILLPVLALAVAIAAAGSVEAYRGDPSVKGPAYTPERHTAMEKAFSSGDYDTWKNLMAGRGRVSQVVTKDNFARFAEAHRLANLGQMEEAKKIRAELGLGLQDGSGRGGQKQGQGRGYGRNR